ncbi:MAG: hypothetical protein WBX00_15170 [Isosphaeraceae bacterium]
MRNTACSDGSLPRPLPSTPAFPASSQVRNLSLLQAACPGRWGERESPSRVRSRHRAERKQCRVPEENLAQLRRLERPPGRKLRRQQPEPEPEQKLLPLLRARQDLGSEERLAVLRKRFP